LNRYQKQVQLRLLEIEEENRKKLTANYKKALNEVKEQVHNIMESAGGEELKNRRAKWHQVLAAQLETILKNLGEQNVNDMTAYLDSMYREGYLGCLFGIHQDGVGLVLQINEDKVGTSLFRETKELKFSNRLYKNADELKKNLREELARGFAAGRDYISIARQLSIRSGISLGRACTIARTEGHRVTEESRFDCMKEAAAQGADIIKQWDATLDNVTRRTHRELDGQCRKVEEEFVIPSTGARAMYPGGFGIAKEDINCRCVSLSRAKWALSEEEYKYCRKTGTIIGLKSELYSDWKNKYNKSVDILFSNAAGKSDANTIEDKIRLLETLNNLPSKVTQSLVDVEYRFGEERSRCDLINGIVYLGQGTTKDVMLHEIGHLLEKRLFDPDELYKMKKKYTEGLSTKDVVKKVYQTEGGKDVIIDILKCSHFLEEYQGRLYTSKKIKEINADGSINVEALGEFISVMTPVYFLEPERFKKEHTELYNFMRRYLE